MGKRKRQQRQLQNFRQPNASAHVVAKRLHGDDILRKDQPVMNTTLLDSTLPSSDSKTSDATVANLVKHVLITSAQDITDILAYERSLTVVASLVSSQTALAETLVPHIFQPVLIACGAHSLSGTDSLRLRFTATECLSSLFSWADSLIQTLNTTPKCITQTCVSGLYCTIAALCDASAEANLDAYFQALRRFFELFSTFCKNDRFTAELRNVWSSPVSLPSLNGNVSWDTFQSLVLSFASGLAAGSKYRSYAAIQAYYAAACLCLAVWDLSMLREQDASFACFSLSRTALKAAFTSLPVVCLPQLFAEMENEVSSAKDRSFVCAQRSWTGALAELLLNMIEAEQDEKMFLEHERLLERFALHFSNSLPSDAFTRVREIVARLGSTESRKNWSPSCRSSEASVSSTTDSLISSVLQRGERLDDEIEILNAQEDQRLLNEALDNLHSTQYGFHALNRIVEVFNHTAQHTDAIDSNANLQGASELIIRLPPLILRLLESSQHRNIVQVCHGAIASVLQLPDLCLAVDSSIGDRVGFLVETYLETVTDAVQFLSYCTADHTVTTSLHLMPLDIMNGPVASLTSLVRAIELTAQNGCNVCHLIELLDVMAEASWLSIKRSATSDLDALADAVAAYLPKLSSLLRRTTYPSSEKTNADADAAAAWVNAQLNMCELFIQLISKSQQRSVLCVALLETLNVVDHVTRETDTCLLLACVVEIFFDVFGDERFDDVFQQHRALERLTDLYTKLKANVNAAAVDEDDDNYRLSIAITNLEAYILYKREHLL